MSIDTTYVISASSEAHHYPASHWSELSRFIVGDERDPKNLFYLADDVWDAWLYAAHSFPSQHGKHRFHFAHLHSFLKPYIKWYCYQRLLTNVGTLSRSITILPNRLTRTDSYLVEHHCKSPDDITSEASFTELWNAQLLHQERNDDEDTYAAVRIQKCTHPFWKHIQASFGFPHIVAPIKPYKQFRLTEASFDESQIIPISVTRQLANKLALHRSGQQPLNRFHHLRLCVLMLTLCLGRRIGEILAAPRCTGERGPLVYYPAKGRPEGSLWFQFAPNKHGPQSRVLVSPKWEDIVTYCVKELIRYSDEVRNAAPPEIKNLLILLSRWNFTGGSSAVRTQPKEIVDDKARGHVQKDACVLSYDAFFYWLNGHTSGDPPQQIPGILRQWKITTDGSPDGEIYHLRTHQARHTRQSAIASDPHVSALTRQRDLNHIDRNMQVHYQHTAREQNRILLEKAKNGEMVGPAVEWFATLFGTSHQDSGRQSRFQPGNPQPLSPRWRNLILNNAQFMQPSHVGCGYCALPQGPGACDDYMNCLEVEDGGCQWFFTDSGNAGMLIQITERVRKHQQQEHESAAAGHEVQAGKAAVLARRAEAIEREVYARSDLEAIPNSSQDLKERLKARRRELEEEGV